jgi:hypothetical protein
MLDERKLMQHWHFSIARKAFDRTIQMHQARLNVPLSLAFYDAFH